MKSKRIRAICALTVFLGILVSCVPAPAGIPPQESYPPAEESSHTAESTNKDIENKEETTEEAPGMISSYIDKLRDPFVLEHNGVYYAYGTGWKAYKTLNGSLDGFWAPLGVVVQSPEDAQKDFWAPEVYEYNGAFYMFTTYYSRSRSHRGCSVFRADTPAGPFVEISSGHVTPNGWDAIDGSLYIDGDGTPWMVFVHEWTSMPNGIGAMTAAKMSDDLTHFISEPIQLFLASDAPWAKSGVTDGCFMYECENGELIMLWSSFDSHGYAVGIARSDNGGLDGNRTHDKDPLFSKKIYPEYDGGHPMVFTSIGGKKYLSIHSPNTATTIRNEKPVFIPFTEKDGKLILDLSENNE